MIEKYKAACNEIAETINEKLFEGCREWYWIGDEIGGLCCFDDYDYLNMTEMVLIMEKGISYEQYAEWRDANIENEKTINLRSWFMGARHNMF